jgi:hypothetical protein
MVVRLEGGTSGFQRPNLLNNQLASLALVPFSRGLYIRLSVAFTHLYRNRTR